MALSVLNNIPALVAEDQLNITQGNLQKTLYALASGSRLNSGADDPAGLAIANGLGANIAALNQSVSNANDGIGALQVADGALGQVTTLLQTAVTLATEASTGTVSDSQRTALDAEFTQIKQEIDAIGTSTTYNGTAVFTANVTSIFLSDATTAGSSTIGVAVGVLSASGAGGLGLTGTLTSAANAQTALGQIDTAVATIASDRGNVGAVINRLQDAANVINVQVQNLTQAEDGITAADIGVEVSNLSEYSILQQTGIAALAQANTQQQNVLNLLH